MLQLVAAAEGWVTTNDKQINAAVLRLRMATALLVFEHHARVLLRCADAPRSSHVELSGVSFSTLPYSCSDTPRARLSR